MRVLLERLAGVVHRARVGEVDDRALVLRAQLLARHQHLDRQPARVPAVVRGDRRPLVVEERRAVRVVDDHGQLGVALVGAVADPQEAAAVLLAVEEVEVHRLVEVLLRAERVGVVVLGTHVADDLRHEARASCALHRVRLRRPSPSDALAWKARVAAEGPISALPAHRRHAPVEAARGGRLRRLPRAPAPRRPGRVLQLRAREGDGAHPRLAPRAPEPGARPARSSRPSACRS